MDDKFNYFFKELKYENNVGFLCPNCGGKATWIGYDEDYFDEDNTYECLSCKKMFWIDYD